MKNITIKPDENLLKLSFLTGKSMPDLIEQILTQAIKARVIKDHPDYCGFTLYNHFSDMGYSIASATLYTLCKSTHELEDAFSELVVWGKAGECPVCGCRLSTDGEYETDENGEVTDVIWENKTCVNDTCNYTEHIYSNEPDPDRDWDDRIMND